MIISRFTVLFVLSFWIAVYVLASAAEVHQVMRIILATGMSSMFGGLIVMMDEEHAKITNFSVKY